MGESGVVDGAALLGDPHGAATEVGDQPLGEGALGLTRGDAEDAPGQPAEVDRGAREGHGGVRGDGVGADRRGRVEHREAVPAGGVDDVLALVDGAAGAEHRHDVAEHVVGHRQQQHVAAAGDRGRLVVGDPRQEGGDPAPGGVGLAGGGHDLVAGGAQGGGQDGADTAGADHAHAQGRAGAHARTFRSSPSDALG